ncbi:androgen-dependent TFPI-regulating protein-like [Bacillus rossius redtenbacheri]|uniref:androgen-dependent TFPI-regulating protein-like n=1 Tax=Bacillus rossius redtenbacheri TaxID=93214 RepID=UPI002FDC909A
MERGPGARATLLRLLHLSAPLFFLWLDCLAAGTALSVLAGRWRRAGPRLIAMGAQLFTVWGEVLQQKYYFTTAWEEVTSLSKLSGCCTSARSADDKKHQFFTSVVFPLSLTVSINFWAVYWLDPALLEDLGILQEYVTPSLNHSLHTGIVVVPLLELLLNPELVFPEEVWPAAAIKVIFAYGVFSMPLAIVCPGCVYPFSRNLSTPQRFLFMLVNMSLSVAIYGAEKRLYRMIWGRVDGSSRRSNGLKLS